MAKDVRLTLGIVCDLWDFRDALLPFAPVQSAEDLARIGASLSQRLLGGFPRTIGRYRIAGRIGAGGMGEVYRAHDPQLQRPLAIKLLRPSAHAANAAARARMLREARALASISHPNVVEVFEVGSRDEGVFIAMELIDGATIRDWIADGSPSWRAIVQAYVQAGRGLQAAHEVGLLHRDFKPSNVIMGVDDRARVLDFGLAKQADEPSRLSESLRVPSGQVGDLTLTGSLLGTPAYMAPECLRGESWSEAADQFSFCVALWEGLFGGRPYAADDTEGLRRLAEAGRVVRPRGTPVPALIIDALLRGLHPDPSRRWSSMRTLLHEIEAPAQPRGPLRAMAFAAGWLGWKVAVGAALVMLFPSSQDTDPCVVVEAERDEDWSDLRRTQIRDMFVEQELEQRWTAFETSVDARMQVVPQAYASACEAVRSDDGVVPPTIQLACLRQRYVRLATLLEATQTADAEQLVRIVSAVEGIDASECDDVPEGVVPATAATFVAQADARLAQVDVLRTEDRYDDAARMLAELAKEASVLGYAPLSATIENRRGDVDITRGKHEGAEEAWASAHHYAIGHSEHRIAMEAAAKLAHLLGVELSRTEEGLQWARHSEAAAARLGKADPRAHLWRTLGNIHFNAGQREQAEDMFERAAVSLQEDTTATHAERISALRQLGNVYLHLRKPQRSREYFARALELAEVNTGPQGHDAAALTFNLALATNVATGDPTEALPLYERAATTYATIWDSHPDLGDALFQWGHTLAAVGRYEEAEAKMREGIEMLAAGIGEQHAYVLDCRANLIEVLLSRGGVDEAAELTVSVLADVHASVGQAHPLAARLQMQLGQVHERRGELDDAQTSLEAAARVASQSPQPDPHMVWETRASLAEFRVRQSKQGEDQANDGRAELARIVAEVERAMGTQDALWAAYQLRALALLEGDGTSEELRVGRDALRVLGRGADQPSYAAAQFAMARLEHAHGEQSVGRALAEALAARLLQDPQEAELASAVRAWLDATT